MNRSFTDVFIKHPVLAAVVNLVIVLVGWRAIASLPVQQFPKVESSSVLITTVYYGASAETVRGFLTTPIERAVSAIGGVDYVESNRTRNPTLQKLLNSGARTTTSSTPSTDQKHSDPGELFLMKSVVSAGDDAGGANGLAS